VAAKFHISFFHGAWLKFGETRGNFDFAKLKFGEIEGVPGVF
jgi:hypothetical protein